MRKPVLLLLLVLAQTVFAQTAQAQTWQDTVKTIESLFARYKPDAPGCELAISRNGQLIYSKAWGLADLEHHIALTTTSPTEAGSVSKQFTAAAILLLQQQGKLSLNDDVRKYIPELPDYGKTIRLRYLMHHTSGIRDWGSIAAIAGWPRTTKTYSNADALDIICRQQALNNTPNDTFIYSNSNYNLFAIIVQRVSGMSLADFTKKYIFQPAGMTHTSWRDNHKRIVPDRAIAYALTKDSSYETNMPTEDVYGNGGLLTTAEDLLKWNAFYQNKNVGGPDFLKQQLATESLNNGDFNNYGAGLFIGHQFGQTLISHDGATASYRAYLGALPESNWSIAWLSNTSAFDRDANPPRQVMIVFFINNLTGNKFEPIAVSDTKSELVLSPEELQPYTGYYYSTEAQTGFTVELKDHQLYLSRPPATSFSIHPTGKDRFQTSGAPFDGEPGTITFVPDKGNDKGAPKKMLISIDRALNVSFTRADKPQP
jgi:CubicO group peptidase (beta-lactamase class C family)